MYHIRWASAVLTDSQCSSTYFLSLW